MKDNESAEIVIMTIAERSIFTELVSLAFPESY